MTCPFSRLITKHTSARSGVNLSMFHTLLVCVFIKVLHSMTRTYSPELWPKCVCAKTRAKPDNVLACTVYNWGWCQSSILQLKYKSTKFNCSKTASVDKSWTQIKHKLKKICCLSSLIYGKTSWVLINQEMRWWQERGCEVLGGRSMRRTSMWLSRRAQTQLLPLPAIQKIFHFYSVNKNSLNSVEWVCIKSFLKKKFHISGCSLSNDWASVTEVI